MLDALSAKLLDPDEKVRAAVCRLYSQLEYEVALHHVSESQWRAIAERGLDKKVVVRTSFPEGSTYFVQVMVRTEALNCIGKAYSLAYPELYLRFHPWLSFYPNSSLPKGGQRPHCCATLLVDSWDNSLEDPARSQVRPNCTLSSCV